MAIVNIGYEEKTHIFGDAKFNFDSAWSQYTEAFSRERQLTVSGHSIRRTEIEDTDGKLSGRGRTTILYLIWVRKGHIEKQRGRKPKKR